MITQAKNQIALNATLPERSVNPDLRPKLSLASQAAVNFASLPKNIAVANTLQRLGSSIASAALGVVHKVNEAFSQAQEKAVSAISSNFGSLNKKTAMLMIALISGNMTTARAGGVLNDLSVAEIEGKGGATILQSGGLNGGQYGIVSPKGMVPQEVAVIVSGNAIGDSFNVSQHHYKLNVNNATLSDINAGPRFVLDMGPALKKDGTPAGTVTTPEGWVVYDPSTYHSESGEGASCVDDNHQLYFRIAALDPNSPSFNKDAYDFYANSTVTRFSSVQSHNDSTAGIPQLSNDANAPVSVYKDSSNLAYVAIPRPIGAAMDISASGNLIKPEPKMGSVSYDNSGESSLPVSNLPSSRKVSVQIAEDLMTPNWRTLTNTAFWVTGPNDVIAIDPSTITNKTAFLRLIVEP